MTALLNVLVGTLAPWGAAAIFLIFSLILLIGCAHWLEVPWIVTHLERLFNRAMADKHPGETE